MKTKHISIRVTQEQFNKLLVLQKELKCNTISDIVLQILDKPDEVYDKLKVIYRKTIVKEILKKDGIDLDTFDWKSYKPTIKVNKT